MTNSNRDVADVQVTCPTCGRRQSVSKDGGGEAALCPACGKKLVVPEQNPGNSPLVLKQRQPPPDEQAFPAAKPKSAAQPSSWQQRPASRARETRKAQARPQKVWLGMLVFLVVGAGLVYIRFFDGWPGMPLETLKTYGMLAVAAAYLFIISMAVRDNMFDGLLSIVVPLYPFYYLFVSSGAVFMRALVGALLVAFGFDTLHYLMGWAVGVSDAITHWIQIQHI